MFEKIGEGKIRVPQDAARIVSFKPLNLMAPWPMKGPFDAIFCRNVAIYFDKPTQGEVFGRLGRILTPGGYLYIGHSENVGSASAAFRLVGKTIYQARSASEGAKSAA
jgi:chemotaxis protein methyltransferase CheR